ncbi:MAG: MFS transporter [Lactobacillaceae bacterium]|nr:MFS transporter [Lactobacillaceae bacterium]
MHIFRQNPKYRNYSLAMFLNYAGGILFNLVFIIYASKTPNPNLAVGIISFVSTLPFVMNFIAGYISDQPQNKFNFAIKLRVLQTVLFLVLALIINNTSSWIVFALVILINLSTDFLGSVSGYSLLSVLKNIVTKEELPEARRFQSGIRDSLSFIAGPIGAGLIALLNNNFMIFALINALTFLISLLLLKFGVDKNNALKDAKFEYKPRPPFIKSQFENYQLLKSLKNISHFTLLFVIINFIGSGLVDLLQLQMLQGHNLRIGTFGFSIAILTSLELIGNVLGALVPISVLKKLTIEKNLFIHFILMLMLVVNLLTIQNRLLMFLIIFISGYLFGYINPTVDAYLMETIPDEKLGQILSIFSTITTLGVPLGPLVFVFTWNILGSQISWLIMLVVIVVGLFYTLYMRKNFETII